MEHLSIRSIQEGERFDQSLFLPNGQKLLNAGIRITRRHMRVLHNLPEPNLFLAESLDELVEAGVIDRLDNQRLRAGQRAPHDVVAAGGQLLVPCGEEIEEHHVDAMSEGVYGSVTRKAEQDEANRARRDRMVMADACVEQLEHDTADLPLSVKPMPESLLRHAGHDGVAWPEVEELAELRDGLVQQIRHWYSRIEAGLPVGRAHLDGIVDELFGMLMKHPGRFTQLALLCPRRENYLPDHACCVTVLAMASAAQLRWSEEDVRRVGLAGLLFDLGMLLVPERIRTGGCDLTEIDRNRVQRHPAYSVTLMECIDELEPLVKLAAYQHHERDTSVGYPQGLRRERICDYAKLLAICDVFAAATSPRGYHKPKLPYVVLEEIIRSAAAGIFDKAATRALVGAAGLFPVGSYVLMSNRRTAHVLAANPQRIDRPLIRLLTEQGEPTDRVIDLSKLGVDELSVVRPAPAPEPESLQPA